MKLKEILDAITAAETKLIPLFVMSPESQAIASIAFVAEQTLFGLFAALHAPKAPAV